MRDVIAYLQLIGLFGLGALFYGWALYPPLGRPMAIATLLFPLTLIAAWVVYRFTDRK